MFPVDGTLEITLWPLEYIRQFAWTLSPLLALFVTVRLRGWWKALCIIPILYAAGPTLELAVALDVNPSRDRAPGLYRDLARISVDGYDVILQENCAGGVRTGCFVTVERTKMLYPLLRARRQLAVMGEHRDQGTLEQIAQRTIRVRVWGKSAPPLERVLKWAD
jgi:hypothetical protein